MQKALYSMEVLYVLTLGLGKLSVMVLFYSLLSSTGQSKSVLAATGLLLVWVVVMAIVVCLQCHPPEVWNIVGGKCLDLVSKVRCASPAEKTLLTSTSPGFG